MKKLVLSFAAVALSSSFALADPATTPSPTKPGDDAPTKALNAATPDMKSPGDPNAQHPPSAAMDKAVPPMKPGDKPADATTTTTPKQ